MVHRPDNALWTEYNTSREKLAIEPAAVRRAGFNFGAPGDRIAEDGTLWLSITPRKREEIEWTPKECAWFRVEPAALAPDAPHENSWIASSGAAGITELAIPMLVTTDKNARRLDAEPRRYDVRLHFIEPDPAKPGQRVFTVLVEGKPALTDLDPVRSASGPQRPLVRELKNVEVHGPLDLTFTATWGKPLLCGVEVIAR